MFKIYRRHQFKIGELVYIFKINPMIRDTGGTLYRCIVKHITPAAYQIDSMDPQMGATFDIDWGTGGDSFLPRGDLLPIEHNSITVDSDSPTHAHYELGPIYKDSCKNFDLSEEEYMKLVMHFKGF
jgi:hypothetical protein